MQITCEKILEMQGYRPIQIDVILSALAENVNVFKYCSPDYSAEQITQIYLGMKEHLDVELYSSIEFESMQMEQIRWGLLEEIDARYYADPDIPAYTMEFMRIQASGELRFQRFENESYESLVHPKSLEISQLRALGIF